MNTTPQTRRSPFSIRQELADMMRDAYVQERHSWHYSRGGSVDDYQPGPQWDDVWPRMADFILQNRVSNYREFIHRQFVVNKNLACCPSPRQCFGPAALRRWRTHQPSTGDIAHSLRLQSQRLADEIQKYRAWMTDWTDDEVNIFVLLDHENSLTALLRYCAAVKIDREDIAGIYHTAALLQYVFGHEQYDQIWGDLIPTTLRNEAAQQLLP